MDDTTQTVYISIGNSDDKLTQNLWAHFYALVEYHIRDHAQQIHGRWQSVPSDPWQNACWCIQIAPMHAEELRRKLAREAKAFRQDSIAWAVANTEFLGAES
ncbi:hypothetical protein ACFFMR_18955 [Micromonospora andamanensis]|uniref:Uncharacterized protein n=1 Tax=Micromonospora andamanensis TaxID=1287068 RepID=A0ABQ4HYP1_9ACTN|nr:hypothetical protein [Micromonospora andamanensis]GIJ10747.1 hypothetical protein Van01_39610 [Micromonospora andamanensis]